MRERVVRAWRAIKWQHPFPRTDKFDTVHEYCPGVWVVPNDLRDSEYIDETFRILVAGIGRQRAAAALTMGAAGIDYDFGGFYVFDEGSDLVLNRADWDYSQRENVEMRVPLAAVLSLAEEEIGERGWCWPALNDTWEWEVDKDDERLRTTRWERLKPSSVWVVTSESDVFAARRYGTKYGPTYMFADFARRKVVSEHITRAAALTSAAGILRTQAAAILEKAETLVTRADTD